MCQGYAPNTVLEELANCVTHGIFIPTSLYLLVKFCSLAKTDVELVNAWVYGIGLIVLFSVSTLYHCFKFTKHHKVTEALRISDHATIYLFIAASYTPWLTIAGYDITTIYYIIPLWSVAAFGIIFSFYTKTLIYQEFELVLYVFEGVVPALIIMSQIGITQDAYHLAFGGFWFLSGIIFFRLDGQLKFAHAIWHVFVYLGTHYHSQALTNLLVRNN